MADQRKPDQPVEADDRARKPYEPPAWEVEDVMAHAGPAVCSKADDMACGGGGGPIQS